jgi:class 3 adenylate cyclase
MSEDRARRLAAVWFADIIGYTALSARDEDEALRVVDAFQRIARAAVNEHGGRVVKFMGDAVLTVFDSVDSALRAALDLQEGFSKSGVANRTGATLRVGLHVGDVMEADDGDLYGDGVNTASRIEGVARPGEVAISEAVYQQIRDKRHFSTEPLGKRDLKGLRSMTVFRVTLTDAPATMTTRRTGASYTRAAAVGVAASLVGFISLTVMIAQRQEPEEAEVPVQIEVQPTEASEVRRTPVTEQDSREPDAAPPKYGMWSVDTQRDPIDDSDLTQLTLHSAEGEATLLVECRGGPSVRIAWPSRLASDEVEIRVGRDRARTVRNQWVRDGDGKTLAFRANPRRFLRELAGVDGLALQAQADDGTRMSAVFRLAGLAPALAESRPTCGL